MLCTISPGDEVILQDPHWLNYRSQVSFFGGVPVPVAMTEENFFSLKAADVEKMITAKTRIMIVNSPNNPTGGVVSYEDLKGLAELAVRYDLLVISDEVYCELMYDGMKHISIASFPGMKERTVVINSFSKSFAMTGWRVGFAAGPEALISKMIVLQENMVSCVAASAQLAAVEALSDKSSIEKMRRVYDERRRFIVKGLNEIPGISCILPHASFYVFANIKATGKSSNGFANELMEKTGVITIPGSAFGENGEGFLRLSYANSIDNIAAALTRIRDFVSRKG